MPTPKRGEVWIADLGMAAKVRPCLILSTLLDPVDRVLTTMVPLTTAIHGTRFEIAVAAPFIRAGVFDAQQLITIPQVKLIRRLGSLPPDQLALVEDGVRQWLGL